MVVLLGKTRAMRGLRILIPVDKHTFALSEVGVQPKLAKVEELPELLIGNPEVLKNLYQEFFPDELPSS